MEITALAMASPVANARFSGLNKSKNAEMKIKVKTKNSIRTFLSFKIKLDILFMIDLMNNNTIFIKFY